MPAMSDKYSVNEEKKEKKDRVYHNNSGCGAYNSIPENDRRSGRNGYRLCEVCEVINKDEAKK
jgi:hypothetical protein